MIDGAVMPMSWVWRWLVALAWRTRRAIAHKLEGFAATEAGSALDMLKAAELVDDPHVRRLFFRHALDEARHAQMFHRQAQSYAERVGPGRYRHISATRQNLFERLGMLRFLAFVWLAEREGARKFAHLRDHFADDPELHVLFDEIEHDERFHVAYSHKLLRAYPKRAQRWALFRVRGARAWEAWRRAGRHLGDLMSAIILTTLYFVTLPLFVVLNRKFAPAQSGWQPGRALPKTVEEARSQS